MYKEDVELVRDWAREHAEYCSEIWSVDFNFENYEDIVDASSILTLVFPLHCLVMLLYLF